MKAVLEFSVIFTVAILPQIVYSFFIKEIQDVLGKLSNRWKLTSSLISRFGSILLALYIAAMQPAGLLSIGLNLNPSELPKVIIIGGLATGYLSLIFIFSKLRSKKSREERESLQRQIFVSLGYSTYKTNSDRIFSLINLWASVIAEELIYRGYLILLLRSHTGTYIPWILLSITFSVFMHLYQGFNWKIVVAHIFLASVFIVVILITNNIITALLPHLVYDTIWMSKRWVNASAQDAYQPESIA